MISRRGNKINRPSTWKKSKSSKLNTIISIVGAVLSLATFIFILYTHQSPPQVNCELIFVQRPDSIFQAQIHLWNSGDITAENIEIRSKFKNVFQTDSTNSNYKLNLWLFPAFEGGCYITPSKILSHLGKEMRYPNYKINIPFLQKCNKWKNFIVITPVLINKKKWDKPQYSLYRNKYVQLENDVLGESYLNEILKCVTLEWAGKHIELVLSKIVYLKNKKKSNFVYFPQKEDRPSRSGSNNPAFYRPKFLIKKERQGGGFPGWATW